MQVHAQGRSCVTVTGSGARIWRVTDPITPSDLLEDYRVPGEGSLFVVGSFDQRVTFYSQQIRALNLIDALVRASVIGPGGKLLVIGAGLAGITAAAAAAKLGVQVRVLEKLEALLPTFRSCSQRFIHPRIYDWPEPGWNDSRARLPLLDWTAASAAKVADQVLAGFTQIQQKLPERQIRVAYNVQNICLTRSGDGRYRTTWTPSGGPFESDAVVLAVGFGVEPVGSAFPSVNRYWDDDDLIGFRDGERTWFVSGCGDGGLIDVIRLRLRDFRHETLVEDLFHDLPGLDRIEARLLEIEGDAALTSDRFKLTEAYVGLSTPELDARLKMRLRDRRVVILNSTGEGALSRKASILNRFLVSRFLDRGDDPLAIEYVVGSSRFVRDPSLARGAVVEIEGHESIRADRVIIRRGPEKALEKGFPEVYTKALKSLTEAARGERARRPGWEKGRFGPEVAPESGKLGAAYGEQLLELRRAILGAIRRRLKDRFLLKQMGGVRVPLREVYREPRLRFEVPRKPTRPPERMPADERMPTCAINCTPMPSIDSCDTLRGWLAEENRVERLLVVFGEVGSGKTELLYDTERWLLERAEHDDAAPIPVFAELRRASGTRGIDQVIAERLVLSEERITALLSGTYGKLAVLLDGADEAGESVVDDTLGDLRARTDAVAAVVVTTRPVYRLPVLDGREARLELWSEPELEAFFAACSRHMPAEVEALRGLLARRSAELQNPLFASLALVIAKEEPKAIERRSRMMAAITGRLLQRTRERQGVVRWQQVAEAVGELAYEALAREESVLSFQAVRDVFIRRVPDVPAADIEDFLDSESGLLVHVDGGYEFVLRNLGEFLAGKHLLTREEDLVRVVSLGWGQEVVRHAVGWSHELGYSDRLIRMLLQGAAREDVGVDHTHLRRVLCAGHITADLGAEAVCQEIIAEELVRRLADETSSWVPERTLEPARRVAAAGGPAFRRLAELTFDRLDLQRVERCSYHRVQTGDWQHWAAVLRERDPSVRIVAIEKLVEFVAVPEVLRILVGMLRDDGVREMRDRVQVHAALALRQASRDDPFKQVLPWLQSLVQLGHQMLSCSAAIALCPDEAPLAIRIAALMNGARGGVWTGDVVDEIAALPGGVAALDELWPIWREQGYAWTVPPLPAAIDGRPAASTFNKHQLMRALTPGLRDLPTEQVEQLIADSECLHMLSHEFDVLPSPLILRMLRAHPVWRICDAGIVALRRAVVRTPEIGDYLLERCERLLAGELDKVEATFGLDHAFTVFPGRALEPRVLRGDDRALKCYVHWLARLDLTHGVLPGGDSYPEALLALPAVRDVLVPRVEAAWRELRNQTSNVMLAHLGPLWRENEAHWQFVRELIAAGHRFESQGWYDMAPLLIRLEREVLPVDVRAALVTYLGGLLCPPTGDANGIFFWQSYMPLVLRFVGAQGLELTLREPLLRLCDATGTQPEARVRLHAICASWPALTRKQRHHYARELSRELATFLRIEEIDPRRLQAVVEELPDEWAAACELHMRERVSRALPTHPDALMAIVEMLPGPLRQRVLPAWLQVAQDWILPWIDRSWRQSSYRPLDEAWRLLFDAGADVSRHVTGVALPQY